MEEFTKELPFVFADKGETIQARRNIIKKVSFESLSINIKRFRKPILINRIVYTFFRKSKAYKAYYNALKVLEKGFTTPEPISFIEEYKNGLISLSYFISTQIENCREIREYYFTKVKGDEELLASFARYTAKLHNAGILHLDYSPGNILISEDEAKGYTFSLVDINRMQFQVIDIKMGCENFCRLFELDEASIFVASEYAKARSFNRDECIRYTLHNKHLFEKKKERKRKLKRLLGKN